jgi:hypothetical protein
METAKAKKIDEILKSPGRIECQALRANISTRQCATNQAQAKLNPYSPLQHCLNCQHPHRAKNKVKSKAGSGIYNYHPKSRAIRAAAVRGELERFRADSISVRLRGLINASTRAGWNKDKIKQKLKAIDDAETREKISILHRWTEELRVQT